MCLVLTFWLLGNYVAAVHLSHASPEDSKACGTQTDQEGSLVCSWGFGGHLGKEGRSTPG